MMKPAIVMCKWATKMMNFQEAADRMEINQNQLSQLPEEPTKGTTILRTCFNGINALSGPCLSFLNEKLFL